jgi:hypothetical protein
MATTNQYIGLDVITELIIGYALPGCPIAMMLFKTWGYITMKQVITFISFSKLAYYMKIAHRPMFFCQVVATIVAGTVQLGVQAWIFSNVEGLCDADQKDDGFVYPATTVFGNTSILVSKLVVLAHTFCIPWLKDVVSQWAATSIVARSALLWPRLLLCRHPCTIVPVNIAQEVQNRLP